jgi:hypothetical protein
MSFPQHRNIYCKISRKSEGGCKYEKHETTITENLAHGW